eukprot:15475724-Alexandrium_andersonii.AAC.1
MEIFGDFPVGAGGRASAPATARACPAGQPVRSRPMPAGAVGEGRARELEGPARQRQPRPRAPPHLADDSPSPGG